MEKLAKEFETIFKFGVLFENIKCRIM